MLNIKKLGVMSLATFMLVPAVKASTIPAEAFESGKLTLKSVPLTVEEDRMWYVGNVLPETSDWKCVSSEISSTNPCYTLSINPDDITKGVLKKLEAPSSEPSATKNVDITYHYDEAVKKVADELIKNLGTEPIDVELNDIEMITYKVAARKYISEHPGYPGYGEEIGFPFNFGNFSGDLMKKIQYKAFEIMVGYGGGNYLSNLNSGPISFIYDGIYYGNGVEGNVTYQAKYYIPEGTTDIVKAIKDRVSKYFDVESVEEYKVGGVNYTAKDLVKAYNGEFWTTYHNANETFGTDQYETVAAYVLAQDYTNPDLYGDIDPDAKMYLVKLKDGTTILGAAIEDTEKANDNRQFKTSDVETGIEISADGIIPLDALIHVARITSGDEYDKIVKILKTTSVDMFDLKLKTSSNESIVKLDNGKFKITLPIKEELQNKELKVYYVDEDGKVEEYDVTISDDGKFGTFETAHFSIYTLAEATKTTKNPKTGDHLVLYLLVLTASGYVLLKTRKFN